MKLNELILDIDFLELSMALMENKKCIYENKLLPEMRKLRNRKKWHC
jgi:hypothetical protein